MKLAGSVLRNVFLATSLVLAASAAQAQSYPSKTVRFVVCNPPGGQIDLLARLTAEKLGSTLGQSFVVENKPGAAGRIAAQDILKFPPDGYNVMFCGLQILTMQLFFKEPGYDLGKDLITNAILVQSSGTIALSAAIPATNLKEFIAYAKANPGKLNYASYGNHHVTLSIEAFMRAEGFSMVPIPYAGTAPMIAALGQGDVHFADNSVAVFKPLVDKGQLRLIATVAQQRNPLAPNVPTAIEQGYPNFIIPSWYAAFIRGGTPRDVQEKLNKELNAAVKLPDVRSKMEAQDAEVVNMNLDEIVKEVQSKVDFLARTATALKIEKQ
jgi:tripartite-type tricarboxylate transporter receptor subunit TctC